MVFRTRYSKRRTYRRKSKTPFKKVNAKRLVNRYKTKQLVKLIKGVTLKQAETCYKTSSHVGYTVYHNTLTKLLLWNDTGTIPFFPTQGLSDGERRGDEIICQGFRIRGIMQIPYDRRNTVIKMWYVPHNSSQGDPQVYTNFFHNVVGSVMCDPVQTDRWKGIRYLGSYRVKARDLDQEVDHASIIINRWIPMKKKVCFNNDGVITTSNTKEFGAIMITAYDAVGTLTTDRLIDNSQFGVTLYYKDP